MTAGHPAWTTLRKCARIGRANAAACAIYASTRASFIPICSVPRRTSRPSSPRIALLQADFAVELDVDLQARELQPYVHRETLVASDRPVRDRLRDRALDLALRADADHLQELADAQVESFFVHGTSLDGRRDDRTAGRHIVTACAATSDRHPRGTPSANSASE